MFDRKLLILLLIIGAVAFWAALTMSAADHGYDAISPQDAWERLNSDETIVLIDVRTPEEYVLQRIPGAVLLPLADIKSSAAEVMPEKDAAYFLYCRTGSRSAQAAALLVSMGYTNIYDLGGIISWPYETESGQPEQPQP